MGGFAPPPILAARPRPSWTLLSNHDHQRPFILRRIGRAARLAPARSPVPKARSVGRLGGRASIVQKYLLTCADPQTGGSVAVIGNERTYPQAPPGMVDIPDSFAKSGKCVRLLLTL